MKNKFLGSTLPTGDSIDSLPFEAPWLSPFGMGLIKITDLRKNENGKIEAQLADKSGKPYESGTAWCELDKFPNEWPN